MIQKYRYAKTNRYIKLYTDRDNRERGLSNKEHDKHRRREERSRERQTDRESYIRERERLRKTQ